MEQVTVNNQLNKSEKSLANAPVKKKIGFISAIMIVIGSSVGAGIFFKSSTVLENSGSNLYWAIFCWVVAAFAVICMALALIEISSARNDNLSMIGWCKTFNGKYIYKACKYFMTFIYMPFTFFFMPFYVILSFQDALTGFGLNNNFNTPNDWAIWMVIALAISSWFIFSSGLSSKAANIQNWIITCFKFIPLVIVAILGFVLAGQPIKDSSGNIVGGINNVTSIDWWDKSSTNLFQLTPVFGIFGGIAAIFFAFDGFYVTAGLQTDMKEPRKTPLAISIGLIIVTVIYLVIAISMSLGSAGGSFYDFQNWLAVNNVLWIFGVANIFIAFGVLGIINGFSMWTSRFIEDLIKEGELSIPRKYLTKLNSNRPVIGTIYAYLISVPVIILFSVIGGLAYFPSSSYSDNGISLYDGQGYNSMIRLLSFADLMATWTSLFAFAFIALAIFGGLRNRKTQKVKTIKFKYFVFSAWASLIIVGLSLIFSVVQPFINLGLIVANSVNDDNYTEYVGTIILCVLLVVFALICFVSIWIEQFFALKKIKKLEHLKQAVSQLQIVIKLKMNSNDSKTFVNSISKNLGVDSKAALQISKLPWSLALNNIESFNNHPNVKTIDESINLVNKNLEYFNIKTKTLKKSILN